jgi:hypothetical protein
MLILDKSAAGLALRPSAITKSGSSHFAFAGDFTIEIFDATFADLSSGILLANWNASSPFADQRSWLVNYSGTQLQFFGSTNGSSSTTISYTWSPTTSTPYQIAIDRSGTTVRVYVDGTQQASGTISGGLWASTTTFLTIAQNSSGSGFTTPWSGRAKAVRITDGVARYAGNYTPPSLPLPAAA